MSDNLPAEGAPSYAFQGEVATATFSSQEASVGGQKPVIEKKTRVLKIWSDASQCAVVHLDGHNLTLTKSGTKDALRWHYKQRDEFSSLTVDLYLGQDKSPKQISIRKARVIGDRKTEVHFTGSCLHPIAPLAVA